LEESIKLEVVRVIASSFALITGESEVKQTHHRELRSSASANVVAYGGGNINGDHLEIGSS
jgi:hypothetical protein